MLGAGGGHGAAGVGGAGVEVEVVFGLCDGGGGGGGRVHEGLGDLGEGEVLVGGEEVLDAGDEGVEVGGVDTVLEPVRQPVADAAEAAEELGAGGGGRGRLGGGRGHHCHAGHFANPGRGGGFSALCLGWWGGEGWWGGYLLLYVCESGDVGACACQGFLESVHLRSGDVLFRAQEPDDEQSKLVERLLAFCFIVQ